MSIHMFNTYIDKNAAIEIGKVLESTLLSEGSLVKAFESRLSAEVGMRNPVAVNSGTSALHLALVMAGVKPGDEVICPAQTFVATAMVVVQEHAIPVFADIQYATGNIEPSLLESRITEKTKAIMVVHWGGYPCDMDEITAVSKKYSLPVIEDAAHAPGATYRGQSVGSMSNFTCFSFQAIKHITTGDGGAICSRNSLDCERVLTGRWFGINRATSMSTILGERAYDICEVGYKYHLNDYAAILGLANLNSFPERLARRRFINAIYRQQFSGVPGITLFEAAPDRESACWLFGMHVEQREDFIRAMNERGVSVSVVHQRIDRNSIFGGRRTDLPVQTRFDETQIHVPLHDGLCDDDVAQIVSAVQKGW